MTDIDCGWPDPSPSLTIQQRLISIYGREGAQRFVRRVSTSQNYRFDPDDTIEKDFKRIHGYLLTSALPFIGGYLDE